MSSQTIFKFRIIYLGIYIFHTPKCGKIWTVLKKIKPPFLLTKSITRKAVASVVKYV